MKTTIGDRTSIQPSLDIIIVNWNSDKQLKECIESIKNALRVGFYLNKVIIVDNHSTDNSLTDLEKIELPIEIILNTKNLGFSKACNQGALVSTSDLLLFLNPDTTLFSDSLQIPVRFMFEKKNERIGVVGVQIINGNNKIVPTCARIPKYHNFIITSIGLQKLLPTIFPDFIMSEWDHNSNRIVDHVMGAFYLVRNELFKKLKGFDEDYFVYLEDLDFSHRLKRDNYDIVFLSTTKIFHKGGGVSEKVKANRLFYILQSKTLFSKKHFNKFSFTVVLFVITFLEPLCRILGALIRRTFSEIPEIFGGYYLFYSYLLKNSKERE